MGNAIKVKKLNEKDNPISSSTRQFLSSYGARINGRLTIIGTNFQREERKVNAVG
jgi:hypothetical protein